MSVSFCRQIFTFRHVNALSGCFSKSNILRTSVKFPSHGVLSANCLPPKVHSVPYSSSPDISSVVKETGYGSKYHPMSPLDLTEERMRDKFFQKKSFTIKEWENIRIELMSDFFILTEANFDSVLMNVLLVLNNYSLAASFMKYLDHIKRKPNFVTCLRYMSLCSKNIEVCSQNTILETFDKIKEYINMSPVLDNTTVDCIVQGLCATDRWEDSFEYLEKLPMNNPKLDTKNALTCAALRNENIPLAWDMLDNWYSIQEQPSNRVFKQYLKTVMQIRSLDNDEGMLLLEKLFKYLISKNIVVKSSLANDVANCFKCDRGKWLVQHSKVNRSGFCSGCKKELGASRLMDKEFQQLRDAFYEKSVKKIDVFINTTEHELRQFLRYVDKHKPFDVVLDGLNAAHSVVGMKNKNTLATQLLKVVRHLSVSYGRILVLGRKHMRNWPFHIWEQIRRNAFVFFASDISEDDPFLIYATLASGPNSVFLSSDLMRDHASKLHDPVLINLFKQWQLSHQIYLHVSDDGDMTFTRPLKHNIQIQGSMEKGWHVPYDDEFILDPYEELNNWLCIQPAVAQLKQINTLY